MRKKHLAIALAMTAIFSLAACGNSKQDTQAPQEATTKAAVEASTEAEEIEVADYWTDAQKDTIKSMHQVDVKGLLWEMKYTADYDLDKLIQEGTWPSSEARTNFQKLFLPGSSYEIPEKIYGGCSAFGTQNADGHQIMGRNYDWDMSDEICMAVHTAPENGYASVGMADVGFVGMKKGFEGLEAKEAALYAPVFTVDGINEKGLACTVLLLDEQGAYQKTGKQQISSTIVVRLLLDRAATVKEAEELLKQYDIASSFYMDKSQDELEGKSFHWLVTDKTGDTAVFEVVDGELVVNRTPIIVKGDFYNMPQDTTQEKLNSEVELLYPEVETGYNLVTNFYVSPNAKNHRGEGFWRYQELAHSLYMIPNPTNAEAMEFLQRVRFYQNDGDTMLDIRAQGKDMRDPNEWAWCTVWSEVYDTETLSLDICIYEDYKNQYTFFVE